MSAAGTLDRPASRDVAACATRNSSAGRRRTVDKITRPGLAGVESLAAEPRYGREDYFYLFTMNPAKPGYKLLVVDHFTRVVGPGRAGYRSHTASQD